MDVVPPAKDKVLNAQEEEALHLSAALVLRAAVYLSTSGSADRSDRWAALRTWLNAGRALGKHTIEVRASKSNTAQHQALVRWLIAAKSGFAQVAAKAAAKSEEDDGTGLQSPTNKKPPPSWVTVTEKKFRSHFDKTRSLIKSWGGGEARAWHVSPNVLDFLQVAVDAGEKDDTPLNKALEMADGERHDSEGLVQLRWPPNTTPIPSTEHGVPAPPPPERRHAAAFSVGGMRPPEPSAGPCPEVALDLAPLRQEAVEAIDQLRAAVSAATVGLGLWLLPRRLTIDRCCEQVIKDGGNRTEPELQRILSRVHQLTRLAGRPPPKSPAKGGGASKKRLPGWGPQAIKVDSKHVAFQPSEPGGAAVGPFALPSGVDVGELCFCTDIPVSQNPSSA